MLKFRLPHFVLRATLCAAGLVSAAGSGAQATSYTFDFVHGDPHLSFYHLVWTGSGYATGGDVFANYAGGALNIGKPKSAPDVHPHEGGGVWTTFTVSGDFTTTVQIEANMNHVCNICGNQVSAFLYMGTGTHGLYVGGIQDENGLAATTIFDSNFSFYGFPWMAYLRLSRTGDVVTASILNGTMNLVASRTVSGPDYTGPAGFGLDYGDWNGNQDSGYMSYRNFTITADKFQGLSAPEPASWGLMFVGLGMAGAAMRRRGRALPA